MTKIKNKKIIFIAIIIVALAGFLVYRFFLKGNGPNYTLSKASRGVVVKEVSETGTVGIADSRILSFKNAGRIEKIYVKTGEKVEAGQELAKLDTVALYIQLQEAQTVLESAQTKLNKLLAGAGPEEIKVAETRVENAEITLEIAKKNLKNSYETAITTSDSSYSQLYNALDFVREFIEEYVSVYDEDGRKIMAIRDKIEGAGETAKFCLETAKRNPEDEDIETALSIMRNSLETAFDDLETIREISEGVVYREKVSAADKVSLETLKTNINNALTNIISSQQAISSMKLNIETSKANLQEAKNQLDLVKVEPRQEDVDLYQIQIKQAEINISLLQNQIQEATLKSPSAGQAIRINKKEGEVVQPTEVIISFLPSGPFQIEADIYEEDIVDINIGDPVKINLAAFPEETLQGKVISIDPAEKIIADVVYYKVTIDFEESREGIKPGMTADIVIEAEKKENVIAVLKEAVKKTDGGRIVQVLKNGKVEERKIEAGLIGTDYIEVVSGLAEGEEVVIGQK